MTLSECRVFETVGFEKIVRNFPLNGYDDGFVAFVSQQGYAIPKQMNVSWMCNVEQYSHIFTPESQGDVSHGSQEYQVRIAASLSGEFLPVPCENGNNMVSPIQPGVSDVT
jgi:hypothetical protein